MNIPSLNDLALIFDKVGMSFLVIVFVGFCLWQIGKKAVVWIEVAFSTFKEFLRDMQASLKDIACSNKDMALKIDDMHKILLYKELNKSPIVKKIIEEKKVGGENVDQLDVAGK